MREKSTPVSSTAAQPASRRALLPRDLALIALFAAFIAVLGLPGAVPVVGIAVPLVLQNLGVFLAASILGPKRAFLAVITFFALVAAGLPLLSGGRGGIAVFASASLGYFIGWALGALLIGWLAQRGSAKRRFLWILLANLIGGVLFINLIGATISPLFSGVELAKTYIGSLAFLPGDILKAVIAALIAAGIHRAYPIPAAGVRRGENVRPASPAHAGAGAVQQ